ncbi:hypothetical protein HPDFL43_05715 [Hoeflea phototrophica DFL-43]|jgi:hypothetical protein|uniref:Uncharacterized protein n=1 Tax=Hoeflea phototrophica (strain DSM 17068 / NCIMB 14078 / DFL-43) TaxID=411684 RepID=A9D4P3_HOEPD|nr:hypothetical protein [Hoeflea phototrophica]EDQ33926.2 hypothetical protein HPDFL43_05715 [Hoeflea phototrophica DFL-43]
MGNKLHPPVNQSSGAWAVARLFDLHRQQLKQAIGVPRAMLGPDRLPLHVFPGDAVPSFRSAGRHLALADVAAMDAVEGRARFLRARRARFGK